MIPSGTLPVSCPPALHRTTYGRLVRTYDQLLAKLDELPQRQLSTRMYMAYQRRAAATPPSIWGFRPRPFTLTVDRRAFPQRE